MICFTVWGNCCIITLSSNSLLINVYIGLIHNLSQVLLGILFVLCTFMVEVEAVVWDPTKKKSSMSKLRRQNECRLSSAGQHLYSCTRGTWHESCSVTLMSHCDSTFFLVKTPKLWLSLGLCDYRRWPIMCNLMSLNLLVFKTDGLPLTNMHFVSNYSEGVSCQSQRRFPEKMGESSTGESVDVVEKEKQFSFTLLS